MVLWQSLKLYKQHALLNHQNAHGQIGAAPVVVKSKSPVSTTWPSTLSKGRGIQERYSWSLNLFGATLPVTIIESSVKSLFS
jgi:hypothetical protein